MITKEQLNKLKELLTKIEPAPWFKDKLHLDVVSYGDPNDPNDAFWVADCGDCVSDSTAEFIALARNLLPEMIKEIEEHQNCPTCHCLYYPETNTRGP